ncbi:Os07g0541850, partial [Oryza sativa Japonica Group]
METAATIATATIGKTISRIFARRSIRRRRRRRRREAVGPQLQHRGSGVELVLGYLRPQAAPRADDPRPHRGPRERLPPPGDEVLEAAPAQRRRQVRRALRRRVDVREPRVGAHPLPRGEQPRGVHYRVHQGGAEEFRDGAVVAGDVGGGDVVAVHERRLAGVVGGGEEVAGRREAGVALVVDEDGVPGAVARRGDVLAGPGAAVVAVGGAHVAAAEDEAVDGVRGGAERAGGEESGRRGGVLLEGGDEALEVGVVGAVRRVRAAAAASAAAAELPRLAGGERERGGR